MLLFVSILLLINAVFNFVVWPPFVRRVAADPRSRDENGKSTSFFRVHMVLITIAMIIATVSGVVSLVAFFSL